MAKKTANTILKETLGLAYFVGDNPAIDVRLSKTMSGSGAKGKLILVVGENASGKSFYRRVVTSWCMHKNKEKIECLDLSIERRQYGGISNAFLYGSEMYEATGNNSINAILGAIRTSRGRDNPHVIIWDEPDIGLGESAMMGAAEEIAEFMDDPPEQLIASVVITHSRLLIDGLKHLPHNFVHFGTEKHTAVSWLNRVVEPVSLENVCKLNTKRYRAIQKILDEKKK